MAVSPTFLFLDLDGTAAAPAAATAELLGIKQAETVAGPEQALAALHAMRPSPAYILLDLGMRGEEAMHLVADLIRAAGAGARFVALGYVNDLAFYRALKAAGVQEYFTHPAGPEDLAAAFSAASPRASSAAPAAPGKIISFISAASGDGASTIALNAAYAMAGERPLSALLVDMDYQFGMQARHLDLKAQFGIRELFEHPERGVDATLVAKMLLTYGEKLHLLAAPDSLRMLPAIHPEAVKNFLDVLKGRFVYTVLDIPHVWTPWTAEALRRSDHIVVVSQLWLRSLAHLSRMMRAWQEAGIDLNRVLIAVNRSGARYRGFVTPQDFERVCSKPVRFYLANDTRTVVNAEDNGKTVLEVGSSQLERQVRDMARELMGKSVAPASAQEEGDVIVKLKRLLKR